MYRLCKSSPTQTIGASSWRPPERDAAKRYALEHAAKLRDGAAELVTGKVTLARLLALYLRHRSRRKTLSEQQADRRRAELWTRIVGGDSNPHHISLGQWERFVDGRTSGAIDAYGHHMPERQWRPVRARTVEQDCAWLRWVLAWGARWRENGHYLLRENPVRGFESPHEENVRRPVATEERYRAIRAVSDLVHMASHHGGRLTQRSYLSELLDIAYGTGRRLSAILHLRYEDLRLGEGPHGAIRWPADSDKQRKVWTVPVAPQVRAALDRILPERPGVGGAYLFPSPGEPTRPVRKELASKWLRQAERLAGEAKQEGSLWHAYRRAWATARKHLPDADVAAAGGWKATETLRRCYQRPDAETILSVVLGGLSQPQRAQKRAQPVRSQREAERASLAAAVDWS